MMSKVQRGRKGQVDCWVLRWVACGWKCGLHCLLSYGVRKVDEAYGRVEKMRNRQVDGCCLT